MKSQHGMEIVEPKEFESLAESAEAILPGVQYLLLREDHKNPKLKVERAGEVLRLEGSGPDMHYVLELTLASGRRHDIHFFHVERARQSFLMECRGESRFVPTMSVYKDEAVTEFAQRLHNLLKRASRHSKLKRWVKDHTPKFRNGSPKIWRRAWMGRMAQTA